MSPHQSILPESSFEDCNYREIKKLQLLRTDLQNAQSVSQFTHDALDKRVKTYQAALDLALIDKETSTKNFTDAQNMLQLFVYNISAALDARRNSEGILVEVEKVFVQAYLTLQSTITAAYAVDAFVNAVQTRKGKNLPISDLVSSGALQAQTETASAVTAVLTAFTSASEALSAARQAAESTQQVLRDIDQLLPVIAPLPSDKPSVEQLEPAELESIADLKNYQKPVESPPISATSLSRRVHAGQSYPLLQLLADIANFANKQAAKLSEATNQATHELTNVTQELNKATASTNAAGAAVEAAEMMKG